MKIKIFLKEIWHNAWTKYYSKHEFWAKLALTAIVVYTMPVNFLLVITIALIWSI